MGIATEKYIRKPLYVDAVRITEENFDEIVAWVPGEVQYEGQKKFIRVRVANPKVPRQTKAYVGDWILWTERGGHKVYTPKAFKAAFDKVMTPADGVVTPPTAIENVTPHEVSVVAEDPNPQTGVQPILEVRESPEMAQARQTIEAEGGTVEEATPQAIADVVNEQQPKVQVDEGIQVADTPTAPPHSTDGKRVLTLAEQQQMRREEITDLIRSGEVVLEQDLAA
jgi:hypothetical protein